MSIDSGSATSSRFIKVAAVALAIAFGLHGGDHMRRGMAASPMPVMVGGLIQGIVVVVAVALILRQRIGYTGLRSLRPSLVAHSTT